MYSSVSLSSTLSRSKKIEQHIREKTLKPDALRFRIEADVLPLSEEFCKKIVPKWEKNYTKIEKKNSLAHRKIGIDKLFPFLSPN